MNKWLKIKKNQMTLILIGITVILFFNFILPGYEKLPYYQNKINHLEVQKKRLKRFSLHMRYHEDLHQEYIRKVQHLQKKNQEIRDSQSLQMQLGKLLRKYQLRIVVQNVEIIETDELFDEVVVKQQLKGGYPNHMRYLKALTTPKSTLVTTNCSFENLNPTENNPELLMILEFKYVLLKP